jgi:hypothetical protein
MDAGDITCVHAPLPTCRNVQKQCHTVRLRICYCPCLQLERGEGCVHWVVDRDPGSLCIGDGMDDMHAFGLRGAQSLHGKQWTAWWLGLDGRSYA